MKKIISEKLARILKNKKQLQEKLKIKISNRGKEIFIDGAAEDEYVAEKVLDALNFGFPFSAALQIKEQDLIFEIIHIKDYTKRHDLETIRARIIGTKGKTLKTLSELSESFLELNQNHVGIIASPENIQNIQNAIISIIQGSKQTNVYKFLETHKPEKITDLGLKVKEK